ncbi:MAG: hypothetical protein ACW967_04355 [Candidatus Hodarchaeales archaeon]
MWKFVQYNKDINLRIYCLILIFLLFLSFNPIGGAIQSQEMVKEVLENEIEVIYYTHEYQTHFAYDQFAREKNFGCDF